MKDYSRQNDGCRKRVPVSRSYGISFNPRFFYNINPSKGNTNIKINFKPRSYGGLDSYVPMDVGFERMKF